MNAPSQPIGLVPFYLLSLEVAGGWGPNTQVRRETHPPVVTHMHYEFQGWLGDDLLTTFPEFIITEGLLELLRGFAINDCEVLPWRGLA